MKLIELLGLPRLNKGPSSKPPTATATAVKAGSAEGTAMANDATKYAAAKQAAIDVLATLTEPSAAAEKKKIVTDLVLAAAAKAQSGDFAGGMALLQQVPARVAAAKQAAAAAFADYDQKRTAAQKLLGANEAEQLLGRPFLDFVPQDARDTMTQRFAETSDRVYVGTFDELAPDPCDLLPQREQHGLCGGKVEEVTVPGTLVGISPQIVKG